MDRVSQSKRQLEHTLSWIRDPRILWIIGFTVILSGGIGLLATGLIFGLLIYACAASLGYSHDQALIAILYAAVIWAPLGCGMGVATMMKFMKGVRTLGISERDHRPPTD